MLISNIQAVRSTNNGKYMRTENPLKKLDMYLSYLPVINSRGKS
jgi:hypothetical protein